MYYHRGGGVIGCGIPIGGAIGAPIGGGGAGIPPIPGGGGITSFRGGGIAPALVAAVMLLVEVGLWPYSVAGIAAGGGGAEAIPGGVAAGSAGGGGITIGGVSCFAGSGVCTAAIAEGVSSFLGVSSSAVDCDD